MKALFRLKNRIHNDNSGLSLVELLVAIAIGAIVSGSIASLLIFSLRMYGKQTVDVEMQQEIQTTSNFIIDAIMESDSFIVSNSKDSSGIGRSDIVILGKFEYSSELSFSGYVFCLKDVDSTSKDGKLFMKKYSSKALTSACVNSDVIVPEKIVKELSYNVAGNSANLLATNIQIFNLSPTSDSVQESTSPKTYSNPFSVNLNLQFAKNAGTNDVKKELHDTIAIRNTLKPIAKTSTAELTPVFIFDASAWTQYEKNKLESKNDELKIVTETVQMEKALGTIQTPGSGGGFNILEIIPDYSADYIQLGMGGSNGDCIDNYNVRYADTNFDRITAKELSDYYRGFSDAGSASSNFYLNTNVSIPGMVFLNTDEGTKLINNELFKLNVLSNLLESNGLELHKNHGIWDFEKHNYCEVNYKALKNWENNNSLKVDVCIPSDLNKLTSDSEYLDSIDLIIFACPADGGFEKATTYYNAIKGTSRSHNTSAGGDITWEEAKNIYSLVINEKVAIACPSAMETVSYGPNMRALFKMLFYVRKDSESKSDDNSWNTDFNSSISYGSGRDVFKNVTNIDEIDDLLNILQQQKYNKGSEGYTPPRPDLLEYDYSGAKFPSRYKNQLIYNNDSQLMNFIADGSNGILGLKAICSSIDKKIKEPPEVFGDIEIVGVSLDGDNGRFVPNLSSEQIPWGWPENTYRDMKVHYQLDAVKLNKSVDIIDKDTGKSVEVDKVIYLNEYEYQYAKDNESRVFCIVDCTDNYNSLFLNKRCVPVNFDQFGLCPFKKCEHKTGIASTYKPEDNQKVNEKDVIKVMECQVDMNIVDENSSTGKFDNYIKITAVVDQSPDLEIDAELYEDYAKDRPIFPDKNKDIAMGTDYALVVVRDLFDLD